MATRCRVKLADLLRNDKLKLNVHPKVAWEGEDGEVEYSHQATVSDSQENALMFDLVVEKDQVYLELYFDEGPIMHDEVLFLHSHGIDYSTKSVFYEDE